MPPHEPHHLALVSADSGDEPIAVCTIHTMLHVEEALHALLTTSDASVRQRADTWLQAWQASEEAWQVSLSLVSSGSSNDVRCFGATVLFRKLRSGDVLAPADAARLRTVVLQQLAPLGASSLRLQLCDACALLLGEGGVGSLLADPCFAALPAEAMLSVLARVPESAAAKSSHAEASSIVQVLVAWLEHAYAAGPFPVQLPPSAAPAEIDASYRLAALECLCAWSGGAWLSGGAWAGSNVANEPPPLLPLSSLTTRPACFGALLARVDMAGAQKASDAADAHE